MSAGWKLWVVGLIVVVLFLVVLAQKDVDELRDTQRRIAVLEQRCQ